MIGQRLREVRNERRLSLNDVATEAHISVATLSRIETNKQGLDLDVFLTLARILHASPNEFLGDDREPEPIVEKVSTLRVSERVKFWRDLSAAKRAARATETSQSAASAQQLEELLAQVDYLREQIESMRKSSERVTASRRSQP